MRATIGTAPARPHTPFHSQPLQRLLTDWAQAQADADAAAAAAAGERPPGGGRGAGAPAAGAGAAPGDRLAERLGRWLGWTDAIALSTALTVVPTATLSAAPPAPTDADALTRALARLQADQTRLITTDPVYLPGQAVQLPGETGDAAAPYRSAVRARQRAMAAAIGPLRARLRAALAAASPVLARLAAIDATFEAALAERERHLLDGLVARIGQRFAAARRAGDASGDTGWRTRFHHDMQRALLAELDLRLQPLHGLLEALRQEQPA